MTTEKCLKVELYTAKRNNLLASDVQTQDGKTIRVRFNRTKHYEDLQEKIICYIKKTYPHVVDIKVSDTMMYIFL